MYVASRDKDVAELMEGVSGCETFSAGLDGFDDTVGSCGGSVAFSLTVTVSNGPPSRLSRNNLFPSRTITMSQG